MVVTLALNRELTQNHHGHTVDGSISLANMRAKYVRSDGKVSKSVNNESPANFVPTMPCNTTPTPVPCSSFLITHLV